jgi:hypothetical protein
MGRKLPSFVSRSSAKFVPADIEVRWHESGQYDPTYIVKLGRDASVYLRPEDAPVLVAKLTTAMAERGDLVDYRAVAAEAVSQLEALAHDASWGQPDSLERLRGVLARLRYIASDSAAREAADDSARGAAASAEQRQWTAVVRGARAVRA